MMGDQSPAQPQEQAPQADPGKLIAGIRDGMSSLMDIMGKSQGVSDGDKQELSRLLAGFDDFVQELGKEPGDSQEPESAPMPAAATPEAGVRDVKPAL